MNTSHYPTSCKAGFNAVIALILLTLTSPLSAQEPVDYFAGNGSFEGGEFVSPLFPPFTTSGSSSAVPGWTMNASGRTVSWWEDPNAYEGDRYIQLRSAGGSLSGSSSARFDFAISPVPFTVGELYELSFWAAGGVATSGSNVLGVYLGGSFFGSGISQSISLPAYTQAEFDALSGLQWQEYVIPFVAGSTSPEMIVSANIPAVLASSMYLDNFSIRPVPEPSGVLLVGLAAGLLFNVRRRVAVDRSKPAVL